MRTRCCVPGCSVSRKNAILHSFPNPKTDFERFKKWLEFVKRDDFAHKDFAKLRKSHFVCTFHFEDSQKFVAVNNASNLRKDAVPTIFKPIGNLDQTKKVELRQASQSLLKRDYLDTIDISDVNEMESPVVPEKRSRQKSEKTGIKPTSLAQIAHRNNELSRHNKFNSDTSNNMKHKPEDIEQLLQLIKAWLSKQPHLPQKIDDLLIRRFISSAFQSVEKTKTLIELNYTLRAHAPEIFDNRDPELPELRNVFNLVDFCPLPKLTEKKHKLFIYRLADNDPDRFAYADVLKAFFMVADYRMSFDREMSEGEIPIFDMNNTTLRHLTKVTLPLLKKYMVYTQEAHPVRLRQIHVLNITPFLDKCMAIVRPFLKSEVAKMLIFHAPNSSTLFDYISPELIPKEYGGTLNVTMESIKEEWLMKVDNNREFYMDGDRWRVDETRRTEDNTQITNSANLFGMQGSFRSLNID